MKINSMKLIMKRILIVNVNWLGDTIFVTPFIRAIREAFPDSYIAILMHSRCREILEGDPRINEIILYGGKIFSLVSQLRSKKFDTAFILRRSLTRTLLLCLSRIPERIGYDSKKSGFLLTKRVPEPSKNIHRVEHFLGLARAAGIEPKTRDYEFFISEKDRRDAQRVLMEAGITDGMEFVVINPGGNWDLKRWPPENFARLGDEISKKFNKKIVLSGAEKDSGLCKNISHLMKSKPVLLCGKIGLKTLGAVFEKAKWVISNDSGPMHIAAGVKTPVVALFGPTSFHITGPYGSGKSKVLQKEIDCEIPCYKLSCKDNRCMKAISVEDVLEAMS